MPSIPTNPPPESKPERFSDEPSGGWSQPEHPSYPPPQQPAAEQVITTLGNKIAMGVLSFLIVGLSGWVWQTNTKLTRLEIESAQYVTTVQMTQYLATQQLLLEKVNIMYERIVLHPVCGNCLKDIENHGTPPNE